MADQRTPLVCFWFRRDLRADDNHAFFQALSSGWSVLPIYIIDDDIRLPIRYEALRTLRSKGVPIRIYTGRPSAVFNELLQTHTIRAVYANVDREPQALKRDKEVQDLLQAKKFDPHSDYIRKWLPEWGSPDYPLPLLDLNEGRDRAIRTYKKALSAV